MKEFHKLVLGLIITVIPLHSLTGLKEDICNRPGTMENSKKLYDILKDIYNENSFGNILLMIANKSAHLSELDDLAKFNMPKIIMGSGQEFEIRKYFNRNAMVVVIMPREFELVLYDSVAQFLNNTRQTRILVIAKDMQPSLEKFQENLMIYSEAYKMTRVILIYPKSKVLWIYLKLNPYPNYHWQCHSDKENVGFYYPEYWRNMQQKPVIIYAEQSMPRVYLFNDAQGNIQYSGHFGRLLQLFAEHYNATLKPYQNPVVDKSTFYTNVTHLVENNLIDIPMTTDTGSDGKWHRNSDVVEVTQIKLMVPCPGPLSTRELYPMLLNFEFFGCVVLFTILFSLIHSAIQRIYGRIVEIWSFFLDDKALPSVLGQSFAAFRSPGPSLKLLYFMMFLTGLNVSQYFAARMKTLFTTPPYHKPIESIDELNRSPLTIIVPENIYTEPPYPIEKLIITKDNAMYQEMRQSFNTSYGYYTTSTTWEVFKRQQQALSHKILCIYDNLTVISPLLFAIRLQRNSEFKEPLDELIHYVHDFGFMEAWYSTTFTEMLRAKEVNLRTGNNVAGPIVVKMSDLRYGVPLLVGAKFPPFPPMVNVWKIHIDHG
ncbi:uncharacterized protein LOC142224458 [Haematobia irritans]|uniref:uncharacterized protein LOC142224458 n=1 Tax=Haematobia irritans TaxID=7368 RepID=UPI003F50420B